MQFRTIIFLSAAILAFFSLACNARLFSPSSVFNPESDGLTTVNVAEGPSLEWSPFVVVHNHAGAIPGYKNFLQTLKNRGVLQGIRITLNPSDPRVEEEMIGLGLDVLGIIPNEALSSEFEVMRYIDAYNGRIKYFQIGNEVTTFTRMTIDQYMTVFLKVYGKVVNSSRYDSVTLLTQSTIGSSGIKAYGGNELRRMVELGLRSTVLSTQRVIVAMNIYTDNVLNDYAAVRSEYLLNYDQGGYRIWVTETGDCSLSRQIDHVRNFYPKLSQLGPERTYYYAVWGGDFGQDSCYSLINNPFLLSSMTLSPLGKLLAGVR